MLHRFLSLLMLLTLGACSNGHTMETIGETQTPTQSQQVKVSATTIRTSSQKSQEKMPNLVSFINDSLQNSLGWIAEAEAKFLASHYSVADRFVEAGGVKLCEAFVYAMSPEWGLSLCDKKTDPVNRQECIDSRKPLLEYANLICVAIVEDSLHFEVDPGMIVAAYENESNLGIMRWNRFTKAFFQGTDVRPPAYRDAGETGIAQLLPPNYHRGTCVGPLNADGSCNGEILNQITQYDRRAALIARPDWQARLGIREIAKHRDWCLEQYPDKVDTELYETWIGMYNQGRCLQARNVLWTRWIRYALRVSKQYIIACDSTMTLEDGSTVLISSVWDECERVRKIIPILQRRQ
jgi:hypothetical protein